LGALVGPLAGGYLFAAVGFFNMCVIMGSFLVLCVPYVFFFTGQRGKFIVRPQDRKSNTADEEAVVAKNNDSNNPAAIAVAATNSGSEQVEDIPEIEKYIPKNEDDNNQITTKS
jgi:predicted lipid-binding transport protein (Tim44 family)